MDRAYSVLEVKSIDEEKRVITGIATTPKTDRMEDIVDPEGAEFVLPLVTLWQHRSGEPVGNVTIAKVSSKGIPVTIQLEKTDEPGKLKELLDYAWQCVKLKLVRGLSIGFNILEAEPIKGTFGLFIKKWEWLELSLVTIPANIDATIQTVKSCDSDRPASKSKADDALHPRHRGPVKFIPPKPGAAPVNITDQVKAFEATRAAKDAERTAIQEKAGKEGRGKDAAEKETFDTLSQEIDSIDSELKDLRILEKANAEKARPVDGTGAQAGSDSRNTVIAMEREEKLEKGIEFARFAMCVAAAKGNVQQALALAETHYPKQMRGIQFLKTAARFGTSVERLVEQLINQKAAVAGGTTTDATWAAPLLAYNTFAGDFLEFLRNQTIVGKFGTGNIPDLRRIPFNVHIKGQTTGGTGYWVGEGKPKPVTKFDFNDTYHGFTKVAAIAVLTEELIRFSDPSAERLVRDALSGALVERIDEDFIDPAITAVAGVRPASITNGVSGVASSGTTADDVRADILALWAAAITAKLPIGNAVYITTPSIALSLSLMMNPLGNREFPDVGMNGGTLLGVPVIASAYVPAGDLVLAFASEIWLSDDNQVSIDASKEASIQMLDNPTNASSDGTPTTMVSMFQTDSIALRAHRFINWSKRRASAVALLTGVEWGGLGS